jgi:hypothetical protein
VYTPDRDQKRLSMTGLLLDILHEHTATKPF